MSPRLDNTSGTSDRYSHLRTGRSTAAVKGVFWSSLSTLVPSAVGMAVFAITSRVLDASDFGLVAMAAGMATAASAFAPMGFSEALIQRRDIEERHLNSVFWLGICTAFVLYAVLAVLAWPLSWWLKEDGLAPLILVIGSRVFLDLAASVPNSLLARSMSFQKMALRTSVATLVSGVVCLVLLFFGFGLWALAVSQLAASAAACVGTILSARWRPTFIFDLRALHELARYGVFSSGNRIVQMISVDQLLIGALLGMAPLGLFSFARRVFTILNDLVSGTLTGVSYALMSSMQSEKDKLREAFLFATFVSAAVAMPMFLGLATIADELVPILFGPHWLDAVTALRAFCAIGCLSCIGILQSSLITSQGRADWWLYYALAKQIIAVIVIFSLYGFGVSVLAVGIAIETYLIWPISIVMTVKILDTDAMEYLRRFFGPALACAGMFASVTALREFSPTGSPALRLVEQIASGAVVYGVILAILSRRQLFQVREFVFRRSVASA